MRRFHLTGYLVITLLCGFADCLGLPNEFVPVNTPALVDHFTPPFFLPLPFGRPPSLPFSRDDAAFRFDFTSPRQAGQ